MIQLFKDAWAFVFGKFKSRFNFWLTLLVIPVFFIVPLWWLVASFLIYRLFESLHIVMYHEYLNHHQIRPRNALIEFIGYYLIAAIDAQSPYNKLKYHWAHHRYYMDPVMDATRAKLLRVKYLWQYCIDLGPHAPHYAFDESEIFAVETPIYHFFQKYWLQVFLLNIVLWISLTSFWTFVALFVFPIWAWGAIFRALNWYTHKMQYSDKDYLVLLYGSQTWHNKHHADYLIENEAYYGHGIWKWLNIDYYVQKVVCKSF